MKKPIILYDPDTDILIVLLKKNRPCEAEDLADGIIARRDEEWPHPLISIEILHFEERRKTAKD